MGFTGNPRDRHEWIDPPKIQLPVGFKKVPGEKYIAVSKNGEVINSETGLSVQVLTDIDAHAYINIHDDVPGLRKTRNRIRLVKSLIADAFEDEIKRETIVNPRERQISISNPPLMREALKQIQETKGRHYPGPLRDQTVWDAVDYLVRQLEELDREVDGTT